MTHTGAITQFLFKNSIVLKNDQLQKFLVFMLKISFK